MNQHLLGIYQGKVTQRYGMKTAMDKSKINGDVMLTFEGLQGDECAEKRFHGGLERALHQYPFEHYAFWREYFGEHNFSFAPAFGENISATGMLESSVYIGDRYQWGEAVIEVSQPRSPCFKLNKRWNIQGFAEKMQATGRCGWLYRVISPGIVNANMPLNLVERVSSALSVAEVSDVFFNQPLSRAGLMRLAEQSRLSLSWLNKVQDRLATNEVENWHFRLHGKP